MLASLRRLYDLSQRRDRRRLVLLVGMMLVAAALEVVGVGAIPAFVKLIVDPEGLRQNPWVVEYLGAILPTDTRSLVLWGVAVLIAVFAIKSGFLVYYFHAQMRFISDCRADLARRLVNAYMVRAPFRFHLRRNTSELMRNVERETAVVAHQVLTALLEISTRLLILVAVLVFLLIAEPWITLACLVLFGSLAGLGVVSLSSRLKAYGLQEQHCRQGVLQALAQGFGSIKESRIMGREQFFADLASANVRRMSEAIRVKKFIGAAMNPATELVAVAGLLLIAAWLVHSGRSTASILATLSMFVVGLVRLRETASTALTHLANLRYNAVAVDPIHEDLTALEHLPLPDPVRPRTVGALESGRTLGKVVEIRNLSFRYEETEDYALRGIDLRVPAGAAIGFVGATGAGKSTLVDLILGLLEPSEGAILVDGVDIHAGALRVWQRSVGYVPQSIYLLDDTIRSNIALGCHHREIDEDAVNEAVAASQLGPLIDRLPEGLDTRVGEHGVRLSGGERQRIGIARALYGKPELLVLDEATSALDSATERAVIDAVEVLKGQRTVLMIAHRLSTVRNCDRLYLLEGGRIEASGTFEELRGRHEVFGGMASG